MSDAEFEYIGYIDVGDVVKYGPAPDNNACHVYRRVAPQQAQETSLPPQGAASLLKFVQHCSTLSGGMVNGNILATEAMKALAASPPAPQEPAAWRYRYRRGGAWIVCAEKPIYALQPGFDVEPLYASPAPGELGAAAVRELSNEEARDVFAALDLDRERFTTEGGAINRGKLRAAILWPAEYVPSGHWLRANEPAAQQAPSESSAQGDGGEKA